MLTYTPTKGDGQRLPGAGRPIAVVPMVPELEALIDELPKRPLHLHPSPSTAGPTPAPQRASATASASGGGAGLPEGLSAHGMRKAATHWWLRNHRDLIANNFA